MVGEAEDGLEAVELAAQTDPDGDEAVALLAEMERTPVARDDPMYLVHLALLVRTAFTASPDEG